MIPLLFPNDEYTQESIVEILRKFFYPTLTFKILPKLNEEDIYEDLIVEVYDRNTQLAQGGCLETASGGGAGIVMIRERKSFECNPYVGKFVIGDASGMPLHDFTNFYSDTSFTLPMKNSVLQVFGLPAAISLQGGARKLTIRRHLT